MATIPEREPVIQSLNKEWFQQYVEVVDMLRLDVIHPVVSGNKWYKLKYNIQHALDNGYNSIVTFGGAYSNHLTATAYAAKAFNVPVIGFVKGIYAKETLTPTLRECIDNGMQLQFVSNEEYSLKTDAQYLKSLSSKYNDPFIIPEGGANEWGREGSAEIASYIPENYTHVCLSVGTGTTLIGIRNTLAEQQHVLGYVPMKKGLYMQDEINKYLTNKEVFLFDNWHCGGFGKHNDELITFMNSFYTTNHIPIDFVYTGKMMMGIQEQLRSGYFPEDARILCIHTGGLQGNVSIKEKLIY